MSVLLAAAHKAYGPLPTQPIAGKDLLGLLLTAEGLLFAALAVSVALQTLAPGTYLPKFVNNGGLAFYIFITVAAVAVGAGATWWRLYGDHLPASFDLLAGPIAIAVAIVAQPVLSLQIWLGIKGTKAAKGTT